VKLTNQTILLTGGTGSFGKAFIAKVLSGNSFRGIIRVFSRDEFKQYELARIYDNDKRLRFFIGDVRDLERLKRAMYDADIVIHAAALKQVTILEYNPYEAVKTNILGSQNVIEAAIDTGVKKAILVSSDKAVSPVNLYGATKMVAEKLFVQGNVYAGATKTRLSVVRYGNVVGSRGSVVPAFIEQAKGNRLNITDTRMTRFWITLEQGVDFVLKCLGKMAGGEIFVPKIPSVKIVDIARAVAPKAKIDVIGIRPGEKIHEVLISYEESRNSHDLGSHFAIIHWSANTLPKVNRGFKSFSYTSDNNDQWLSVGEIKKQISGIVKA